MARRFATLLLVLSVTFAGLLAKPHTAACCVVRQTAAHQCCKIAPKLMSPACCQGNHQLTDRAVHTQPAPPTALPVALGEAGMDTEQPALQTAVAVPLTRGLAPPASLIAQHTLLLL